MTTHYALTDRSTDVGMKGLHPVTVRITSVNWDYCDGYSQSGPPVFWLRTRLAVPDSLWRGTYVTLHIPVDGYVARTSRLEAVNGKTFLVRDVLNSAIILDPMSGNGRGMVDTSQRWGYMVRDAYCTPSK